jgi:hypothetical protein
MLLKNCNQLLKENSWFCLINLDSEINTPQ